MDADSLSSRVFFYSVKKRHDASIGHHSSYYLTLPLSSLPLIPKRPSQRYPVLDKLG